MKEQEPAFTLIDRVNELKDIYFSGYISIIELADMVKSTPKQVSQFLNYSEVTNPNRELIDWGKVLTDMNQPTIKDFKIK